jgi:hypothetical protein
MSYVHGHPRDTGWVVAHVRRPSRAAPNQLPLLVVVPPLSVPDETRGRSRRRRVAAGGAGGEARHPP